MSFISRFEQPWSEYLMNLNCRADNLLGQSVYDYPLRAVRAFAMRFRILLHHRDAEFTEFGEFIRRKLFPQRPQRLRGEYSDSLSATDLARPSALARSRLAE